MATGSRWWFGLPVPASLPYLSDQLPSAFLICSAEDMTHYLIAQTTNGSYAGSRVLSLFGIGELQQGAALVSSSKDGSLDYGMGWFIGSTAGVPTLSHTGDTANFHAEMVILYQMGWGIVLLFNANGSLAQETTFKQLTQGVTSLLVGQPPPSQAISFSQLYLSLDLLIVLLSALQLWYLWKVLSRRKHVASLERRPGVLAGDVLLAAGELVVPLMLVIGLPLALAAPWSVMLLYQPDTTFWLIAMMLLSAGTGITQVVLMVMGLLRRRDRSRGERGRKSL
jgi:CubicO group peptidase (beta-lactamase class C family)